MSSVPQITETKLSFPAGLTAQVADFFAALSHSCQERVLLESRELLPSGGAVPARYTRIMLNAALRLRCQAEKVTVTAQTKAGQQLLSKLCQAFSEFLCSSTPAGSEREATFHFPPPAPGLTEAERLRAPNPLDLLNWLQKQAANHCATTLYGGFAFEFVDTFETTVPVAPAEPGSDFPDYLFYLANQEIVLDLFDRELTVKTLISTSETPGQSPESQPLFAHSSLVRQIEDFNQEISKTNPANTSSASPLSSFTTALTGKAVTIDEATLRTQVTDLVSDETFTTQVQQLQENIAAGDIYQVVPARGFRIPCADAWQSYRVLRDLNPSPYLFYLQDRLETGQFATAPSGNTVAAENAPEVKNAAVTENAAAPSGNNQLNSGIEIFGASPESAVRVDENRKVTIRPIAGTKPRVRKPNGEIDTEGDIRQQVLLRGELKENAEHLMLVDLARNDLARIAQPGSRTVTQLLTLELYARVMHLVSQVEATLDTDLTPLLAYRACMNMGTLTGAPKLRALELLRQVEKQRRGIYGGAIGYYDANGVFDTAIAIRCAQVCHGQAWVRAGAGVVRDSSPSAEAAETRHKASAVLLAIAHANQSFSTKEQ